MTDIGVKELESLVDQCFEQRKVYEAKKKEMSEEYAELERLKSVVIGKLEALGIDKFEGKLGKFSYKYEESFKVPKDTESREKFFTFLKEKGVYEQMITVNSRTLNSFAKQEAELAEEDGNFDYQIPGLEKSDPVAKAVMRKS